MSGSAKGSATGILRRSGERSLLVLVVDVSPVVWNIRALKRKKNDEARFAANKDTAGPGILEETLKSIQAFCGAYCSLQRDCGLMVLAVAGNESAVVFPRKDSLHDFFVTQQKLDVRLLQDQMTEGVAILVSRKNASLEDAAAMASAVSKSLCCINRFLVANNNGGVSALVDHSSGLLSVLNNSDDGVLGLMGSTTSKRKTQKTGSWSPRIFIVQASADRSRDYNAFMNCAFAAVKHGVVIDGCFIPSGIAREPKNSAFLEQACDRTDGVYLAPTGMAQVGPALTEILVSIFLPPATACQSLNMPSINKVDFRARCFESGEAVDMAYVCNQCLSIFKKRPREFCPTCGADIKPPAASASDGGNKKQKLS